MNVYFYYWLGRRRVFIVALLLLHLFLYEWNVISLDYALDCICCVLGFVEFADLEDMEPVLGGCWGVMFYCLYLLADKLLLGQE